MTSSKSQAKGIEFSFTPFTHDYYFLELDKEFRTEKLKKLAQIELKYSELKDYRKRDINYVPVIRLYGTTNDGNKCCIHVHGYFPYFYVKIEHFASIFSQEGAIVQFGEMLERAFLAVYSDGNKTDFKRKFATLNSKLFEKKTPDSKIERKDTSVNIIHSIEPVKKKDFYSYHTKKELFLKISTYSPEYIVPLCEILASRIIMDTVFLTYESHIIYFMKFYTDCNIKGMHETIITQGLFRKHFETANAITLLPSSSRFQYQRADISLIPHETPELFSGLPQSSFCFYELDIHYTNIANKTTLNQDKHKENFLSEKMEEGSLAMNGHERNMSQFQIKITKTLDYLWEDEKTRRADLGITEPVTQWIKYHGHIETSNDSSLPYLSNGTQETLRGNVLWDESNYKMLDEHIRDYYTSLTTKEPDFRGDFYISELQIAKFKSLQQEEKEAKKASVMRQQEERNAGRQNNKMRKILAGEINNETEEEQFGLEKENLEDSELRGKEIGEVTTKAGKETAGLDFFFKKAREKTKASTSPRLIKCNVCSRDVLDCICILTTNKGKVEQLQELLMKKSETKHLLESLDINENEDASTSGRDSLEKNECFPNYYSYARGPPSVQATVRSLIPNCNEEVYQHPYFTKYKEFIDHFEVKPNIPEFKTNDLIKSENANSDCLFKPTAIAYELSQCKDDTSPSILNNLKAPFFTRIPSVLERRYGNKNKSSRFKKGNCYKYVAKKPPSVKELLESLVKSKEGKANIFDDQGVDGAVDITKTPEFEQRHKNLIADLVSLGFEIFAKSRPNLLSDPEHDEIVAIFFVVSNEKSKYDQSPCYKTKFHGVDELFLVKNEHSLIVTFINLILRFDPDLIYGYNIEKTSLYYVARRAYEWNLNFTDLIGRSPSSASEVLGLLGLDDVYFDQDSIFDDGKNHKKVQKGYFRPIPENEHSNSSSFSSKVRKEWSNIANFTMKFQISGRTIFNVWRILDSCISLQSYKLENVAFHALKMREPVFSDWTLTQWYEESKEQCARVLKHMLRKVELTLEIITFFDIIQRTVEMARIYGVDFDAVMARGGQFKIEAATIRVTRSSEFLLFSPTKSQIAQQQVLQCKPLVIDPPKQFFPE